MEETNVLVKIVELLSKMGVENINKLPGCYELEIGDYYLTLNGHGEPAKNSLGDTIASYCATIYRHGMPVIWTYPLDGISLYDHERKFIEAIDRCMAEIGAP